jgi:hypothetical protein
MPNTDLHRQAPIKGNIDKKRGWVIFSVICVNHNCKLFVYSFFFVFKVSLFFVLNPFLFLIGACRCKSVLSLSPAASFILSK